jgi:spermidine/putrescine-binding protein
MKMKKAAALILALTMVLGAAGCSWGAKKSINLFIWTEYMPQSVLDGFEKETGVKVNITTFSSIADMYAKVKSSPAGTYDVVDSAEIYVDKMAKEGLLEKLNYTNIPNKKNIDPSYLGPWYDTDNTYSLPYLGGVVAICYNKSLVSNPPKSYADLFDPQYKDSIVMVNDFRVIIGSINEMLGYDYNETDPAKLAKTEAKLMELKPNIRLLDSDSPKTSMINGETKVGLIYSAEIAIAMEENPDIQVVYPTEGQYLFLDSLCVAKGTKNKDLAEKFINYVLDPEVSKSISEAYPYSNPNKAAMALMDDAYKNNPVKNIPSDVIAKGFITKDVGTAIDTYNDMWTKFTE